MPIIPRFKNLLRLVHDSSYRRTTFVRLAMSRFAKQCPNVRFIGVDLEDQRLVLPIDDRVLTPQHIAHGLRDANEFAEIIQVVKDHGYDVAGTIVEIGGNIGTTTVAAARLPGVQRIFSFEPDPSNYEYLETNVAINHLQDKVVPMQCAVGSEVGSVFLQRSQRNRGAHQVLASGGGNESTTVEVPCTTIDQFIIDKNLEDQIRFIWIDVQGYEGFVLQGAKNLLAKKKVAFVVELWPHGLRECGSMDAYRRVIKESFDHFIDLSTHKKYSVSQLDEVIAMYPARKHFSNLLLLNTIK
jgi:FkbM family methyltransferase